MIDAHKDKYWNLYIGIAEQAAMESVAERRRVGCCIVTNQGMIAVGWNGMPAGFPNECEYEQCLIGQGFEPVPGKPDKMRFPRTKVTDPRVIHAERNALDKLTREGISPKDALVFVTCAPCIECAKSLYAVGVSQVFYRDAYHNTDGINFLKEAGVVVERFC